MTIASLPMYDLPEIQAATNAWWNGLARALQREELKDVPDHLSRGGDYRALWTSPDLLLSQTCGYPFVTELRDKVSLVATPCYSAPACNGPNYCSIIITQEDSPARHLSDLRDARCAVNSRHSHSGYNCLRSAIAPLARGERFFREVKMSGSHPASVSMIIKGEADVAAIDCVTHALMSRHSPEVLARTRILALTPHMPGLPYITRGNADTVLLQRLRSGLEAACHDPSLAECRETLMIRTFSFLSPADYECIISMETAASRSGYPEVA
jgi:ABC-type phosphate/phosphonate transport system substrate-binding protein